MISIKNIWFHYYILAFLLISFLFVEFNRLGDFGLYYDATSDFLNEENIYKNRYVDNRFWYFGSPVLTIMLCSLQVFSAHVAAMIFGCLSVFAIIRSLHIVDYIFNTQKIFRPALFWLAVISICFPLYFHFHFQQFTLLTMYLGLEAIFQIKVKNNQIIAGLLVSLGIFIKLYTIVLIPYFIYRGKFKSALFSILFSGLFIISTFLFFDVSHMNQLWIDWIDQISKNEWNYLLEIEAQNNHGIGTFISTLLIEDLPRETQPYKNNILNLNKETVLTIIWLAKALLVSLTLFFLKTLPFKNPISKNHFSWEISYLFLVIPLIFPQQRQYNFVLLLPAVFYCIYYLINNKNKIQTILFIVLIIILNLELLLGNYRGEYHHFKTLTCASLGILILLIFMPPKKIKPSQTNNL